MNHASSSASRSSPSTSSAAGRSSDQPVDAVAASVGRDPGSAACQDESSVHSHKTQFLDGLIRNLDIVFYAQISALYYMDLSTLRFIIRALPHWFCFTPKPGMATPIPLRQRPIIGTVLGTNILCALCHVLLSPPSGGEAVRGYLHGGLMIDFVGQSSPVHRGRLLAFDLLCLILQALLFGVTLERDRIRPDSRLQCALTGLIQDHDAEEAGLWRSSQRPVEEIEMGHMGRDHPINVNVDAGEEQSQPCEQTEILLERDALYAGQAIIADFHLGNLLQQRWQLRGSSTRTPATSGMQAAATDAGRRFTSVVAGVGNVEAQ